MSERSVEVWLDQAGSTLVRAGLLRPSYLGGQVLASTSFRYDDAYLNDGGAWALSPDLPMRSGWQFAEEGRTLFGAFADASPDDWGQKLIQANHANLLRANPGLPKRLGEFDFLLGVSDGARMGAIRLRDSSGTWLSSDAGVANLHDLDRILEATRRYETDDATEADIAYLNDVATSPGGARPKANVWTESGRLAIAKLPHSKDGTRDAEAWEHVALELAARAGIATPPHTLMRAEPGASVLIVDRFDRVATDRRIGYISGATALELGRHDGGSRITYEEFADTVAELSTDQRADLAELFRRIALTVLVNNVDDHWRNHGFVRTPSGWRLSPVFDVNPSTQRGVITSVAISAVDDPRRRELANLLEVARAFRLGRRQAQAELRRVAGAVQDWPRVAAAAGIDETERARMAPAFDPAQRDWALALRE